MKEIPFANSLAVASAIFYVVCRILALIAPGFLVSIFESWVHTVSIAQLAPKSLGFTSFVFGLVSLVVVAWAFGYAWAFLYNRLSK